MTEATTDFYRATFALFESMARDNPSWGGERLANELLLTLGLRVSPRTVRKYMPKRPTPRSAPTRPLPTLADLCEQSRQCHGCLRFPRRNDGDLSPSLCIRGDGTRESQNPPPACDRTSHGPMDAPEAARSDSLDNVYRFSIHCLNIICNTC
jgi:hypothetical protein